MSLALYLATVVAKQRKTVKVELTINHPDEHAFGTDRLFAWKILAHWVSPDDETTDPVALANRYVKTVTLAPLKGAKVAKTHDDFFTIQRGKGTPSVVYTIEVTDPALLATVAVDDSAEMYDFVEAGKGATSTVASPAGGAERYELVEGASAKFWQWQVRGKDLVIEYGRLGTAGQSNVKSFASAQLAAAEGAKLVREKTRKGYALVGGAGTTPSAGAGAKQAGKQQTGTTRQAGTKQADKQQAGKSAAAPTTATDRKSYADLQSWVLAGIAGTKDERFAGWSSERLLAAGCLQRWARGTRDHDLAGWIGGLPRLYRTGGAALVGLERVRAGDLGSARGFLKLAEAVPTDPDDSDANPSLYGPDAVIALGWRLGATKKADAAFARVIARDPHQHKGEVIFSLCALGGRWDLAQRHLPGALENRRNDDMIPGVLAAFSESPETFAALMREYDKLDADERPDHHLSAALMATLVERDDAARYLELMLRHPRTIDDHKWIARVALLHAERKDPEAAVALCRKLLALDSEVAFDLQCAALGVLARHASELARERLAPLLAAVGRGAKDRQIALLAAAGPPDALRKALAKMDLDELSRSWIGVETLTHERGLAVELLKRRCQSEEDASLVQLIDLGERAWVDELLTKQLASLNKERPGNRDLRCRSFCRRAAQAGRPDLALAAAKLPTPALREHSAQALVAGAASVGDFTSVLAALERIPEDRAERINSAIHSGLRVADGARTQGPRALPLAIHDDAYVTALAAAGARPALEWMRVAHAGRLSSAATAVIESALA